MTDITGIYMIQCSYSLKVYVGSSTKIYKRFNEHMALLNRGKHHSYKLQNHFNSMSKRNSRPNAIKSYFELYILEECSVEELSDRELVYIKEYCAVTNGFNINYDTRRSKPRKKKKVKQTFEQNQLYLRYRDFI